ncbi:MAG TPA: PTS sugar transporter subunit IIA [Candidatus Omnitrophica bacterium]|nr:PTS sugar transporter subunit IIA [Candidatus Omnitrophota bacterium]
MDINILDYLDKDSIIIGLKQKSKKNILSFILDHLIQKKKISKENKKEILKALLQREEMGSTAIGGHIALPHARLQCIKDTLVVSLTISKEGVNFDSLDQGPVNIIALLLSNQKEAGLHLKMLAFLARMLRDKYFVQQLKMVKSEEEVLALVNKQQQVVR